jgi:hypothetical protein
MGSSVYAGGISSTTGASDINIFCSSNLTTHNADPQAVVNRKNIDATGTNCSKSAIVPNLRKIILSALPLKAT